MNIAILTIGDELLNGDLSDTNTAAIAGRLLEEGLRVREAACVGDREDDIAASLQRLAGSHEVVIVTGGLGPTDDDRTARAAARAFGKPLRLNDEALGQVRERFRVWGRPMHPGNEKQALLPSKSGIIVNRAGTAPGFHLQQGGCQLFFLPGVPHEMLAMLETGVLPILQELCPDPVPVSRRILQVFGLAEPDVEARLRRAGLPTGVELAFAVELPMVQVKLQATGEQAESLVNRAELAVRQTLGDFLVAIGDETLAGTTARLLCSAELTLALAESCTGGLIASLLTDQPGASDFLERGAVTYANSAKSDWLAVPATILNGPGAVSAECALAMARGIRRVAGTDIGLAVTGIAGPSGGSPDKPVGTVYIAMATAAGERCERFLFPGNRQQVRRRTACTALDWLRRLAMTSVDRDTGGEAPG